MMSQRDRDRLVVLKKALKKLIKQSQAAQELGLSARQVRRLLSRLKVEGDRVVIHGLRGRPSNRKTSAAKRERIIRILSQEVYGGFGPTLASEYLAKKHRLKIGREALRQIMIGAGLWRPRRQEVDKVHVWRPRRNCRGELVQWDTSEHDRLEGRGEKLYLIHMIDDASSELTARFVRHDSTEENMRLLWSYLERRGRPVAFYTDKASLFQTTPKVARDVKALPRDERGPLPPTQIGRALQELGHRVDRSALAAGQRAGGAQLWDRTGPAGEGPAGGGCAHAGASQPVSGTGLPALVESASGGGARQSGRRTPATGTGTRFGGQPESGADAPGGQRLHAPARRRGVPDCRRDHA